MFQRLIIAAIVLTCIQDFNYEDL